MKTRLYLTLSMFVFTVFAQQVIAEEEVKQRFTGSNPGPPIGRISIDDTVAIPFTEDRRFLLVVNLEGAEDSTKPSPAPTVYRARARMVEQSLQIKKGKKEWVDVATVDSTDWLKLDPTIGIENGALRLNGKTVDSLESKKKIIHKPLEISVKVTLGEDSLLIAEATATWGERSANAEWEHEVSIVGKDGK